MFTSYERNYVIIVPYGGKSVKSESVISINRIFRSIESSFSIANKLLTLENYPCPPNKKTI